MEIITFPHPTLRHKSKPIKRVDAELRDVVREMFDLMYEAKGIGLAANQVDMPVRLFVMNLQPDRTEGEEYVFINPVLTRPKGNEEKEEGCLSIPGVYGDVRRPERITLTAYNLKGEEFKQELDGMFARCVQHETDHLDGVLFTDRLSTTGKMGAIESLEEFELEFQSRRDQGQIPSDQAIAQRRAKWEAKYC